MSKPEQKDTTKQPKSLNKSDDAQPDKDQRQDESSDKKKKKGWKIDHYVASTVALVIISMCALFVSIYQTRVLSQQQEVMSAQQEIMMQNAKAQLWPNLEVGVVRAYDGTTITELQFEIVNNGTGPAIIEGITVEYDEEYAESWWDMWSIAQLPDSIPRTISNSMITNRVMQAGEYDIFLSLSRNRPLMEFLEDVLQNGHGPTITICYRSVFNEYWQLERQLWGLDYDRAQPVEACTIADSIQFIN